MTDAAKSAEIHPPPPDEIHRDPPAHIDPPPILDDAEMTMETPGDTASFTHDVPCAVDAMTSNHGQSMIPFSQTHDDPFVTSAPRFLELLVSMHRNEEAFLFKNRPGDIEYMFRSSAESTQQMMVFELVVPYDPADDPTGELKTVFESEYACMPDDTGDYIFETMTLDKDASLENEETRDEVDELVDLMNYYYDVHICECGKNLVKTDDFGACFECHARASHEILDEMCLICSDRILTKHGRVILACCVQPFHKKCLQTWKRTKHVACPVCRTTS